MIGTLRKKGLPVVFVLILSLLGSLASAGDLDTGGGSGDDVFANVKESVCVVASGLKGPVGIAVGFLVLVGGLVAMQVANRDAIPMITRAVVGTALLLGAGAAFSAIVYENGCV